MYKWPCMPGAYTCSLTSQCKRPQGTHPHAFAVIPGVAIVALYPEIAHPAAIQHCELCCAVCEGETGAVNILSSSARQERASEAMDKGHTCIPCHSWDRGRPRRLHTGRHSPRRLRQSLGPHHCHLATAVGDQEPVQNSTSCAVLSGQAEKQPG